MLRIEVLMEVLMEIECRSTDWFRPYAGNPRVNDHAIDRMAASIQEFGFKVPILARSNGEVVDGHLRLKGALKAGLQEVPVIFCDEWSDAQVRAFRLVVNRSATWAHWDLELLAGEIGALQELSFDLSLTGFEPLEIDRLLWDGGVEERGEAVPEPPVYAVTRPGDLWSCGPHRVLCADATCAEAVLRLLGTAQPSLMVTDQPYGVNYDPQWREQAGLGPQRQTGKVSNDHQVDWSDAYRLFPGQAAYLWHGGVHAAPVAQSLLGAGWEIRAQIIWVKPHFVLSRGDYHWRHEPCYYAVRRGRSSHWRGDRTQSTVWEVPNLNPFGGDRNETATGHATQKPVELMRRPILNHLERGEVVYDPFLGSGTTLVAAELTGRVCYGLEIDSKYVDVIVQRWQKLTGQRATLEGHAQTFDQVKEQRLPVRADVDGQGAVQEP